MATLKRWNGTAWVPVGADTFLSKEQAANSYAPVSPGGYLKLAEDTAVTARPTFAGGFRSSLPPDANSGGKRIAILVKPTGEGNPGVIDWMHADNFGYLMHFQSRSGGAAPAAMVAMGLDYAAPDGGLGVSGLLIANKKRAQGIILHQHSTLTDADAFGLYGLQESAIAPLMNLRQAVAGAAPLLNVGVSLGVATTDQKLARFSTIGNHLSGDISAYDGTLRWIDPVKFTSTLTLKNEVGAPTARLTLTDVASDAGLIEAGVNSTTKANSEIVFYRPTGSSTYWANRIASNGLRLSFSGASPAAKGAETFNEVFAIANNAISFFGATTAARKARVGALVDSTTGTANPTASAAPATYDPANENVFRATMVAKINALDALLSAAAGGYGLTA